MRVAVRRLRAQQIRALLNQPGTIDIPTFNKEVWGFESSALLDGQNIKGQLFESNLSPEQIILLQAAIDEGRIEIHGNLVWKSASGVFAPRTSSNALRQQHIDNAITILNQKDLAPFDKAKQLGLISGIGKSTATGLVMLFHPTEFALHNNKSTSALKSLGYDTSSPEAFQSSAKALKEAVEAKDFLELDWFLTLSSEGQFVTEDKPHYWWVCQGTTYKLEREGEFIWAPKVTKSGRPVSYHEAVAKVEAGDLIVHYSNKAIRSVGIARDNPTISPQPMSIRGNGWAEEGHYVSMEYFVLDSPIRLEAIPKHWRIKAPNGPFNINGEVNQGYLFSLSREFIENLRSKFAENLKDTPLRKEAPSTPKASLRPRQSASVARELPDSYNTTTDELTIAAEKLDILPPSYVEPSFDAIYAAINSQQLRISRRMLLRYHLSLKTRSFVILAGPSGTGKTWLGEAYAEAVGAKYLVVPVAPNWTTNEDLLGYQNPISGAYHDTALSQFLRAAGSTFTKAQKHSYAPQPYHLILDEMNLARVEYYFARFLSAMEQRARSASGTASMELAPNDNVLLPPNLVFVGTVNMDETTHGFADKVFDRAQLIELEMDKSMLLQHLGDAPCAEVLVLVWEAVGSVAPFAFRVVDEILAYLKQAEIYGVGWEQALDEQLLQKILPKLKGADPQVGEALRRFVSLTEGRFPLSHEKASRILSLYNSHGIASYF
ncbi:MAG: AAA family ATPase [Armatimonas sp.]